MAEIPDNNIEKQLQDYAKQRREAAGTPEMHPATRQMLQAEVKQQAGTAAPSRASVWRNFWPRLAFACGLIVLLGFAAMFILPPMKESRETFSMAKLEEKASPREAIWTNSPAPSAMPVAASAPPTAMSTAAARKDAAKSAGPMKISSDASAPASVAVERSVARNEPKASAKTGAEFATPMKLAAKAPAITQTKAIESNSAPVQPLLLTGTTRDSKTAGGNFSFKDEMMAKAAAPGVAKESRGGGGSNAEPVADKLEIANNKNFSSKEQLNVTNVMLAAAGQRFRCLNNSTQQKAADQLDVLDEFTVAQNGELLTVVDRDGSVYNGYARLAAQSRQTLYNNEYDGPVQMVPNTGGGGRAGAALDQRALNRNYEQSRAANANIAVNQTGGSQFQNGTEGQNYFFRVEGTNRSLNQRVIFTGTLLQNAAASTLNNRSYNTVNSQTLNQQQNISTANQAVFNNSQQMTSPNNMINGRVQVGEKKSGELNALCVDR